MKRLIYFFVLALLPMFVSAAVINVAPGTSNPIKKAATNAASGDVLVLSTGEYVEGSSIKLEDKVLTIKAAEGAKPVLKMGTRIETKAELTLIGLSMESNGTPTEGVRLTAGSSVYSFHMRNCTMKGYYVNGSTSRCIRVYDTDKSAPFIDSISVDNCLFLVEGESVRGIEASVANKQIKNFKLTHCTFDGGKGTGRMIYVKPEEGTTINSAVVDHCTFYNAAVTRPFYFDNLDGAKVSNSIFMNAEEIEDYVGFYLDGEKSAITNCIAHNAPVYGSPGSVTKVSLRNPRFVDAANGDFRFYSNSPAVGKATDGSNIGDPRWGVISQAFDPVNEPYDPYKKPYSMAPTTNSVKVLWQMLEEDGPTQAVVRYGTDPNNLNLQKVSSEGWNVEDEGFVHIVTLTGLQPFTRYYFTVGDAKRQFEKVCSTKTAPETGTAFRIFSISDIHGNSCQNWSNMQDFICNLNCDISLMNGDFVSSKGNDRNWNKYFFTPGQKFLAQVPTMSSVGNHETGDPDGIRWSTYYDYFHQFSHEGPSEGPIIDPRGEAYFHFKYGNMDVIMLNINGDENSPEFLLAHGARQYAWADSILATCDRPWIIICHHVGIHTTGYHGTAADWPRTMGTLFEKYAAAPYNKHIISLSGDDHSFEHLYKDGVHYVRPGCGRNANYDQHKELDDYNYSLYYNKISCYSTLDMAADASYIDLTARDSVGNVFYTYRFTQPNPITAIETQKAEVRAKKIFMNGAVYIRKPDGELYSIMGLPVKKEDK